MDLSILIPTRNRSEFLDRALTYYKQMECTAKFIIGDSSDDRNKTKEVIKKFNPHLDIKYDYYPVNSFPHDAAVIKRMSDFVKTNYVAFAGDDDFFIPKGAEECIKFLNSNNDFIAAHGTRINFMIEQAIHGQIVAYSEDIGYEWLSPSPLERWREYMRNGIATVSFVHRSETWHKYYEDVQNIPTRYIGTELIICSRTALLGKVKRVDTYSCAFQRNNPNRLFSFEKYTLFDLINSTGWPKSSNIFMNSVIELLVQSGMGGEDARNEVYKEFWHHCLNVMIHQFNYKYDDSDKWAGDYPQPIALDLPEGHPFIPIRSLLLGTNNTNTVLNVKNVSHTGHGGM